MKISSIIFRTAFDKQKKEQELKELEAESQRADFWDNPENASEISQKIADIREEILKIENLENDLKDLKELEKLADGELKIEFDNKCEEFEKKLKKEEISAFLNQKYDSNNAILQLFSGAGGVDAQDWTAMMLRMYERYCGYKGYKARIISQSFGEGVGPEGRIGIKSATLEIKGRFAYGTLKYESGVHRLVRLSPFSAKSLRHTSFAQVIVLPEIGKKEAQDIEIRNEDMRMDVYKSSGPGGQNVNKRETAVRITHIPTGLVVSCQSERLQGLNRDKALSILKSKLAALKLESQEKEIKDIKGEEVSASWGNQIRSYVLHPYKMVKDNRTGLESSNPEDILDGKLEDFIEEEIKM